jgi:hypothetical protein
MTATPPNTHVLQHVFPKNSPAPEKKRLALFVNQVFLPTFDIEFEASLILPFKQSLLCQ